jgi:ribosomal-protein-alanine N-acetyltransferase
VLLRVQSLRKLSTARFQLQVETTFEIVFLYATQQLTISEAVVNRTLVNLPIYPISMISVRSATADDVPVMMEIAKHAVTAAQWGLTQYEQMFSSERAVLVIEENGKVMGFIVGRGLGSEWEIENVAVSGSARRRGLGSHLLGEFLHHVRSSGGQEVFLEVRESNRAARALYEKWAFLEAGRRKSYYQNPREDALILKFYFP